LARWAWFGLARRRLPSPPCRSAQSIWVASWFLTYNQNPASSNPAGPAPIRASFDEVAAWAAKQGVPLWLGEFGAYSKADMQSRINWTTFIREEAESRGISWAYWEFGSGFGVYDRAAQRWNEGLLRALILPQ
jgi:endoglucanase